MSSDQKKGIICSRTAANDDPEDESMTWVGTCGCEVWFSLKSQRRYLTGEIDEVICLEHFLERMRKAEEES